MSDATLATKPYSHLLGPYEVRRWYLQVQDVLTNESWQTSGEQYPLRKVVVGAAIRNPFAGRYEEDLSSLVESSALLGAEFGRRLVHALAGRDAESYGKAAIVGHAGEYEHGNAFLTTKFADPIRHALGEAKSWIPSTGKRGAPSTSIDIPLAHKAELYVRSHYDTITVAFDDAPAPDDVVILFAVATGGRIRARLGGPKAAA